MRSLTTGGYSALGNGVDVIRPRVVSLLPFLTDIVHELKLGHLLVAISHECDTERDIGSVTLTKLNGDDVEDAVQVSAGWNQVNGYESLSNALRDDALLASRLCSFYHVDMEKLAQAKPTHVLTHIAAAHTPLEPGPEEVEMAMMLQVPSVIRVLSVNVHTLAEIYTLHHRIAALLRTPAAAVAPVASARSRLGQIASRASVNRTRPSVAVVQWTNPTYLAGGWIPEVIKIAGGTVPSPMPAQGAMSRHIAPKEVFQFDYVVFVPCAVAIEKGKKIVHSFWKSIPRSGAESCSKFVIVDGTRLFSWLGVTNVVRTAEVISEVVSGRPWYGHKGSLWEPWDPPNCQ